MLPLLVLLAFGAELSFGKGWEGSGYTFKDGLASSSGTALLHRTLVLPDNAAMIEFEAAAFRPEGGKDEGVLDVVLEATLREYLPRLVLDGDAWISTKKILPPLGGRPRGYAWKVDRHAGRTVRIALMASDPRPGARLVAGRFKVLSSSEVSARRFARDFDLLGAKLKLGKSRRNSSRNFTAIGDARPAFIEQRLEDCEMIYPAFFSHFRKKGFTLREPEEKLLIAVFRTQAGFDAYVGRSLGPSVTGIYHTGTNRLVLYDYSTNAGFLASKKLADDALGKTASDAERLDKSVAFGRYLRDRRDDVTVSTTMHEVAHQLSFNSGLLNRASDVPAWLAEGLAVYCESAVNGQWQGVGQPNPRRLAALPASEGKPLKVRELAANDDWARKAAPNRVVLGYAQAWLLFRMLIEENPRQLRTYLQAIRSRRGSEHRLADLTEAFGSLRRLEARYAAYVAEVVKREGK